MFFDFYLCSFIFSLACYRTLSFARLLLKTPRFGIRSSDTLDRLSYISIIVHWFHRHESMKSNVAKIFTAYIYTAETLIDHRQSSLACYKNLRIFIRRIREREAANDSKDGFLINFWMMYFYKKRTSTTSNNFLLSIIEIFPKFSWSSSKNYFGVLQPRVNGYW